MPVLVFLVLLWAAVLIPVAVKAVSERRAQFASSFGDGLQALEQAEGFFGPVEDLLDDPAAPARGRDAAPSPPSRALVPEAESSRPAAPTVMVNAALLRSILAGLLIAALVSLLAAGVTADRAMLAVNLALDDCLLLFVAILVLRRDSRARRRVRQPIATALAAEPPPDEIELPLPRRAHTPGVPVIAAPVVGAMRGSIASTG